MSSERFGANDQGDPGAEGETLTGTSGPSEATSGTVIGPYHLLQLIGEGGMGAVWLAEQKEPVRRRVAVKLIKVGMDTREVVARFESERQALALMDHPAIAKVFDAGTTREGRPYFVMEYVAGLPITDYCDKHKLTTRQRLELFILVCEGVQHAHQKAIIHRDLKPSNILVTEVDGKPMPRIIDFGVAKATSQRLSAGTMYTRVGTVIGTLGYMSPEQADSAGEDIDTRSDVYSLGAVLYELLVGALPLDFHKLAFDEVLRRLRGEDAPRPSRKLRTLGDQSAITAQNRGADLPTLARQLRGDADAITLKALEKDRSRRYSAASELAADIGRYLRNEPVTAHPPSAGYRARKYIRRHGLGVAVAAAGVVLLIAFAIAQTVELRRITRERNRADRVTEFMTEMFKVSDPSEARGNSITARELLDKSSKDIDTGLANDPELQAQMLQTMSEVYSGLGLRSRAETLLTRAVDIRRRVLGPDNPDTLDSMSRLSWTLYLEGRYPDAEKLQRETLAAQQRVLGNTDARADQSIAQLGSILSEEGRYPEAEKLERELLEIDRKVHPQDSRSLMLATRNLGWTLSLEGHYSEAEKLLREALDLYQRNLGAEDPETLKTASQLGAVLLSQRHFGEAEKVLRQTIDIQRRVLGPEHPSTTQSVAVLATTLSDAGRYAEAEPLYRQTLDIHSGPSGPSTGSCWPQ